MRRDAEQKQVAARPCPGAGTLLRQRFCIHMAKEPTATQHKASFLLVVSRESLDSDDRVTPGACFRAGNRQSGSSPLDPLRLRLAKAEPQHCAAHPRRTLRGTGASMWSFASSRGAPRVEATDRRGVAVPVIGQSSSCARRRRSGAAQDRRALGRPGGGDPPAARGALRGARGGGGTAGTASRGPQRAARG